MKAKFLALAALVLGLASCQTDTINGVKVDANGEAPVTIQVALPEATRAAGADSAQGAIGNVDMTKYDIRFILEVYDERGALAKERQVVSSDATTATFSLRLVPGRHYSFVAWADFVKEGSQEDLHYNTNGDNDFRLTKVELKSGALQNLNDETRDAYTGVFNTAANNGEEFSSSTVVNFTLTRPFAKLRVVTTDMNQLYSKLTQATVDYETYVYTSFDALSQQPGDAADLAPKTVEYGPDTDTIYANEPNNGQMTLFADYLFGTEEDVISFTLDVDDATEFTIPTVNFNTSIPVQRNHLTTIYGPVLTDANNVTVTIDSDFEQPDNDVEYKRAGTAAELQEAISSASADKETHIVLTGDINLDELVTRANDNVTLTIPAGKSLSINLNGNKLFATSVGNAGNKEMFLVKGDLTFKNGTIEYKHTGSDMEWNAMTTIFDITAGGVVNLEGVTAKNLGGSAMAFVAHLNNWGEATLNVNNSTLESTYIAVRAFNSGNDMNNISIYNSTLKGKFCFWVHNYKAAGDSAGTDATLNVDICNGTNTFEYTGKAPILYGFDNPIYYNENGAELYFDAASLAAALTANNENIVVTLGADIELPISSLGQQTGGSGEYKLGGEATENITIDLNRKKLTITTTYWSGLGAKNADALFTIKNGTMTSSQTSGTWNSYDLCFANCNYAFENVTFEKAIALESAGKSFDLKNVTIKETHDYYAMWISAKGQTVTVDGLTIESLGRGIKIDEQYVSAPAKVTLNLNNATFTTAKKAAIVVKSVEGAEINVKNINIANVAADNAFAVWVDENSKAYADKVVVNGAYAKVEGDNTSVSVSTNAGITEAIANGAETIVLADGAYNMPAVSGKKVAILGSKDVVITVNKPNMSGSDVTFEGVTVKGSGYSTGVQHVNTVTYNNVKVIGEMCLYGEAVTFNNCEFELNNQYIWTYGAKNVAFNNCVFNTNGKAILVYNEGAGANNVTVKGCTFKASAQAFAGAIKNQCCAAIEIDNFQSSGVGAAHNVTASDNTYESNFSGEWRIKNFVAGNAITVNGTKYTQIAVDGNLMTIDANKNVTVLE